MKPSSSTSDPFGPLFRAPAVAAQLSATAYVQAMLDAEAALAGALADAGLMTAAEAQAIAQHCDATEFDATEIAEGSWKAGNPVVPLVSALTALVEGEARRYIHKGATSQDILDTATVLVMRRAGVPLLASVDAALAGCADLARTHRDTVQAGRTLGQQAVPITFGLTAAAWLTGLRTATARLTEVLDALPAQLGGAAGTLASLGEDGIAVLGHYARRLGLTEPDLAWHTLRGPVADLAGALGTVAGALGKIATDLVLLAQTEIAEIAEPEGAGGSSTMPHKRNPICTITALAAVRRTPGLVATLLAAMPQEHERATSGWHAEWQSLRELVELVGAAAEKLSEVLNGLNVDADRMRTNLDATHGLLLAENVTTRLSPALGRLDAHHLVTELSQRAVALRCPLRDVLVSEPLVTDVLSEADIDAALDPSGYLGVAREFVDRALSSYRKAHHG